MAEPTRVLVVDDSSVARSIIRRALERVPDLVVVDTAPNGQVGIQKVRDLQPDAVTLDIEMPVMDGLETLRALKKEFPALPVIMVSSLTVRGAEVTVDALMAGADSYIAKPSGAGSQTDAIDQVANELIPKLRAVAGHIAPSPRDSKGPGRSAARHVPKVGSKLSILAIGSSTGGPAALLEILSALPPSFPLPIVITQHMPPMFTEMLAKRLTAESQFHVREGIQGAPLVVGEAWVAPGDFHMTVNRALDGKPQLGLNQQPPVHSCRPAVDMMFRSVALTFGAGTLSVVLTGMGQDGCEGSRTIREAGGVVLAQDEASSVVWGMPGFVAKAGLAHGIVPLAEVARTIGDYVLTSGVGGLTLSRGADVNY